MCYNVAMKTKTCTKCKTPKLESEFSNNKNSKDGLHYQCKQCTIQYYEKHKEELSAQRKQYREGHKKELSVKQKQYRENNPEKEAAKCKKYHQSLAGKLSRKRAKDKRLSTPKGRLDFNISIAICTSLKRKDSSKNGRHWETLVGYTVGGLKKHLESRFEDWMNWDNYGYGEDKWCVDHKRPVVSFNFGSSEHPDFKECWGLKNLQPMRCSENFSKGAKFIDGNILTSPNIVCYDKVNLRG